MWINRWSEEGAGPLHAEWRGLAHDMGEAIALDRGGAAMHGIFVGVDERFGLLLRDGAETRLVPLSALLEG